MFKTGKHIVLSLALVAASAATAVLVVAPANADGAKPSAKGVAGKAHNTYASGPKAAADGRRDVTSDRLTALAGEQGALGVSFDSSTGKYVVRRPAAGTGSDLTAADFRAVTSAVQVQASSVSRASHDGVGAMLRGRKFHADAKRYGYGWYFDARADRVVVETNAPAAVRAPLAKAYGDSITFRSGAAQRATRRNDSTPHWGGASITTSPPNGQCTSAFTVQRSNGTRHMVTAAHCFNLGATVFSPEGGWNWGTVAERGPFPLYDMEIMGGGSYGSYIYRGDLTGAAIQMAGAANPVTGFDNYCFSGQTSGEQCGHHVDSLTGQFCDAAGCTTDLIVFSGGNNARPGDSGSPFYVYTTDNTKVHARGMVIAIAGGQTYAEKWSNISAHYGATIVTG